MHSKYLHCNRKRENYLLLCLLVLFFSTGCENNNSKWSMYKADEESSSYSPLKEITKENVHQLKIAWIFNPNDVFKDSRFGKSECNPIVIDVTWFELIP